MNMRPLTAEDIVYRASAEEANRRAYYFILAALLFAAVLALYRPVHSWLHAHLELLLGILIGSLLQAPGWLLDRWRWMKWFSHQ